MADDEHSLQTRLYFVLFAVASAALVVTAYHWVVFCCRRQNQPRGPQLLPTMVTRRAETPSSLENPMAELIPAHKYQKGMGLVGTCAICLCEFQDGEEVRTLPDCMHSYHVPCIDMWLHSHSSCPMCRARATPSPSR